MPTILVIEQDPATLLAQGLILRSLGYSVLEAGSRGEAWRICNHHHEPIDLVITNDTLGSSRTRDLLVRLSLMYPDISAIITFGTVPRLEDMPCECILLQRPLRVADLAEAVKVLLGEAKLASALSVS